jgi:hypothetical protein
MTVAGDDRGDDERLLTELGEAIRSRQSVPPSFVEDGKFLYTWHGIDFELAALSYDSAVSGLPGGVRAETPSMRALTFVAGETTIEVEVAPDAVTGQVVPPQPGSVEVHVLDEEVQVVPVDDAGWFEVRPRPDEPFRLGLRTVAGRVLLTDTITP